MDSVTDPKVETPSGGEAPVPGAQIADPPPAQADPPAPAPPDKDGVQTRINKLTRDKYDAQRDAAYWKGVAETKSAPAPAAPAAKEEELDPHDFDSDSDYLKAVANQARDEIRQEATREKEVARTAETQRTMAIQYSEGRKKHPDFDEVALSTTLPISRDMFDAATGANLSDILYHLGKNPAEAARIAALPAVQQIKEIGRIEGVIAIPPGKTITNAPNPPSIVDGGGSPLAKLDEEKSQTELNTEWEKERRTRLGV